MFKRYGTVRTFQRKEMTRTQCIAAFREASKRFVRAQVDLDVAEEAYDRIRDYAFKKGWKLPKTVLTNPLVQKR